ncbi:MAG: hypothetical protein ACYDHY_04785 [Acidiferrobacterales bacterium]
MDITPGAGRTPDASMRVDVPRLIAAHCCTVPTRLRSGASRSASPGHRSCAFRAGLGKRRIPVTSQAICAYRKEQSFPGPRFLGMDAQALSAPDVLAASRVEVVIADWWRTRTDQSALVARQI